MISEERKATVRHFFFALGAAFIAGGIGSVVSYVLPLRLAGDFLSIALFCVLAYIVLTHYTSVFCYEINGRTVTLTRRIGAREKQIQIKCGAVVSVGKKRPEHAKITNMSVSLLSGKHAVYLTYRQDGSLYAVRFEPSETFLKELGQLCTKADIIKENA